MEVLWTNEAGLESEELQWGQYQCVDAQFLLIIEKQPGGLPCDPLINSAMLGFFPYHYDSNCDIFTGSLAFSFDHYDVVAKLCLHWRIGVLGCVDCAGFQLECSILERPHHRPSIHPAQISLQWRTFPAMTRVQLLANCPVDLLLDELYPRWKHWQPHWTFDPLSAFPLPPLLWSVFHRECVWPWLLSQHLSSWPHPSHFHHLFWYRMLMHSDASYLTYHL